MNKFIMTFLFAATLFATSNSNCSSAKVGLIIGRFQPLHTIHANTIRLMAQQCDTVIVALGSCQNSNKPRYPFTANQRKTMLTRVFKDEIDKKIYIIKLNDLSTDITKNIKNDAWINYVLQTIKNQNLPSPTDFYTGSLDDAKWYFNYFANPEKISKSTYNAPKDLQLGKIDLYENPETHRCLHIINESRNNISATVIRQLIETSKLGWEKLVPSEIVDYIKENYPKGLIKSLE